MTMNHRQVTFCLPKVARPVNWPRLSAFRAPPYSEWGVRAASGWMVRTFCIPITAGSAVLSLGVWGVARMDDKGSSSNPGPTTNSL